MGFGYCCVLWVGGIFVCGMAELMMVSIPVTRWVYASEMSVLAMVVRFGSVWFVFVRIMVCVCE